MRGLTNQAEYILAELPDPVRSLFSIFGALVIWARVITDHGNDTKTLPMSRPEDEMAPAPSQRRLHRLNEW